MYFYHFCVSLHIQIPVKQKVMKCSWSYGELTNITYEWEYTEVRFLFIRICANNCAL